MPKNKPFYYVYWLLVWPYFCSFAIGNKLVLFKNSRINSDSATVFCFSCKNLKYCKIELESCLCMNTTIENYNDHYCCTLRYYTSYQRDQNSNDICQDIIKQYRMNTKVIRNWKAVQNHVETRATAKKTIEQYPGKG